MSRRPPRFVVEVVLIAAFRVAAIFAASFFATSGQFVSADEEKPSAKQQALQWTGQYRQVQVLFHDQDIARLEALLKAGTDQQAASWLEATAAHREALDSPRWRETQQWLRDFLRVQAIYTPAQIAEFRTHARKVYEKSLSDKNVAAFVELLIVVENVRLKRIGGANAAMALQLRNTALLEAQQKAVTERAARKRAAVASRNPFPPKPTITRSRPSRTVRPPVISALDVARRSTAREVFRSFRRVRGPRNR